MFLRADDYDASMAAERIATYFTTKLSLFGEDKLVKKLELSDLQQQDIKILSSGMYLKLPHDSIGRPVMFVDFSKMDLSDQDAMVRVFFSRKSCFRVFSLTMVVTETIVGSGLVV